MKQYKLPHIPRFISAKLFSHIFNLSLWLGLGSILAANYVCVTQTKPLLAQTIEIQQLGNKEAHRTLASYFAKTKQLQKATREAKLAYNSPQESQILGMQTVYTQTFEKEQNKVQALSEREYWLSIVSQKPDYRDAWLQLARVSQILQRYADMEAYLQQAKNIDPNLIFE